MGSGDRGRRWVLTPKFDMTCFFCYIYIFLYKIQQGDMGPNSSDMGHRLKRNTVT